MKIINKHLDFLEKTSNDTCLYLYKKELSTIQAFCVGLLERLSNTALTLKTLFQVMDKEIRQEFGAGVLVRALLLDTLGAINLFKLIKDLTAAGKTDAAIEAKVQEFCETIFSDALEQIISYLENAYKFGFINKAQLKKSYNNMADAYKSLFNEHPMDGSRPDLKYKTKHTPTSLFKNLAHSEDLIKAAGLYDLYLYFSKYYYFGILYYQIVREDVRKKMTIYRNAIESFVAAQAFLHIVLAKYSADDAFLHDQSVLANAYFVEKMMGTL